MGVDDDEQVLSARWVFPATSSPLAGGTVTIQGDRIVSVDPAGEQSADLDFGNAAIIPGLVNAHTHLDLSGLRGRTPPSSDFVGWLRSVVGHRRERSAEQTNADVKAGLDECLRFGTTLVGDITSGGSSWESLGSAPVWSVCFRELLGLPGVRVHAVWEELVRLGSRASGHGNLSSRCQPARTLQRAQGAHRSRGPLVAGLYPPRGIAIRTGTPGTAGRTVDPFPARSGCVGPDRAGAVLGLGDVEGLAGADRLAGAWQLPFAVHASAAECYRGLLPANARSLRPPAAPIPRDDGAAVSRMALGTDSLASNPDLDLLAEARWCTRGTRTFPANNSCAMATINGSTALGFGGVTGSLQPGKSADLVVNSLPDEEGDPYSLLFAEPATPESRRTMWRGSWRS